MRQMADNDSPPTGGPPILPQCPYPLYTNTVSSVQYSRTADQNHDMQAVSAVQSSSERVRRKYEECRCERDCTRSGTPASARSPIRSQSHCACYSRFDAADSALRSLLRRRRWHADCASESGRDAYVLILELPQRVLNAPASCCFKRDPDDDHE